MTSLPYDPSEATAALSAADPVMGDLIARKGEFTLILRPISSPYEALLRAIIYQQLSGKAAATILGRLLQLYKDATPTPQQFLHTPDDTIRACGVSRNKLAALRDLATQTLNGTIPPLSTLHDLSDAEIIRRLTAVHGVGPWTVQMMLIFSLGRPDVLPATDLGVRNGFQKAYGLAQPPTPKALEQHGLCWKPYRSVASWYLWRAADTP